MQAFSGYIVFFFQILPIRLYEDFLQRFYVELYIPVKVIKIRQMRLELTNGKMPLRKLQNQYARNRNLEN